MQACDVIIHEIYEGNSNCTTAEMSGANCSNTNAINQQQSVRPQMPVQVCFLYSSLIKLYKLNFATYFIAKNFTIISVHCTNDILLINFKVSRTYVVIYFIS